MSRVLVVEDEQHLAAGLRFNLEAEGYTVETLETGETALARLAETEFDVLVLDVMLPGMDGFAVVSALRNNDRHIPTLMLTARSSPEDVLRGFAAGADDYLPKPFDLAILIARIRSLLRRQQWARRTMPDPATPEPPTNAPQDRYEFNGRVLDFNALELKVGARTLPLTLMEANLLRYLVQHEGRTVSRKAMLEDVWGVREDTDTRAIDNFIVRLRRYIEDDSSHPRHLQTARGVGYRFVAQPAPGKN